MELYRHIDRTKVQFDFVKHTHQRGQFEDEIEALGGKVYEAPKYKGYNHLQYCRWWNAHLQAHPEHQVIHGHHFTLAPIFFSVCKRMGRTTIGHSHSTKLEKTDKLAGKIRYIYKNHLLSNLESLSDYCFACS